MWTILDKGALCHYNVMGNQREGAGNERGGGGNREWGGE